jgi:hypothetical protein
MSIVLLFKTICRSMGSFVDLHGVEHVMMNYDVNSHPTHGPTLKSQACGTLSILDFFFLMCCSVCYSSCYFKSYLQARKAMRRL